MDFNSSMNQNMNGSGTFTGLPPQQNLASTNFTTEQLIALQQMQINAQMGNLTFSNGLQPNLYTNSTVTTPMSYPTVPNLVPSSPGMMPGVMPLSPTTQMPSMQMSQSSMDGVTLPMNMFSGQSIDTSKFDPQQLALYLQLHQNIPSAVDLRKTVKRDLIPDAKVDFDDEDDDDAWIQSPLSLTPLNLSSPNTPNISSRRQLHLSETSSTTSSGPASPSSGSGLSLPLSPLSGNISGPNSPRSPMTYRQISEPKSPNVQKPPPTRGSSLKFETKYPQDQCYRCMKKVYPMEKIGPVKDVVYHKGCFSCKVCGTKLNLKNFCHNKNDDLDIHIYCRSHYDQGVPKPVHLDANSVLIKSALSVPKLDKVNEQIRGGEDTHRGGMLDAESVNIRAALNTPKKDGIVKSHGNKYHLDMQSLEIKHARNVPVNDLQTGNKIQQKAWRREERKSESVPPPDVVKYSDRAPEYDMESLRKIQVENNPDYDS